jgi:heat shock protein HslJ
MSRRLLAAALLLAACGETASQAPEPRPLPARSLTGQTWVLDRLGAEAIERPVTATFAAGRVTGVAPCNSFSGPYAAEGTALRIGPLAATRRACPDLALEGRFLDGLGRTASARFTAAQMELLDAAGAPLMVFVAAN